MPNWNAKLTRLRPGVNLSFAKFHASHTINSQLLKHVKHSSGHAFALANIRGLYFTPERVLIADAIEFNQHPINVFHAASLSARHYIQETPQGAVELPVFIAANTLACMRKVSKGSQLKALAAREVWHATQQALLSPNSSLYFTTLRACNALTHWFPELEKLWGIPNPSLWHPEIDTGLHTMMVLQRANQLSNSLAVRYAALVHDLGKALTDTTQWPSHHGHDDLGLQAIQACSDRLGVPNESTELALLVSAHHSKIHRLNQQSPANVLNLLCTSNAFAQKANFENLLLVCQADFQGRKGFLHRPYPQVQQWMALLDICTAMLAPKGELTMSVEYIQQHPLCRQTLLSKIAEYLQQNVMTQAPLIK